MEDQLARLLDPEDARAWAAYEALERDGRRPHALAILEHVVQRLLTYPAARENGSSSSSASWR